MIIYNYETDFLLPEKERISRWISNVIISEGFNEGDINYIFCDDDYLHKINVEFLQHDTLTDIISFDYTVGKIIQGDIFISIERVQDNSREYNTPYLEELHRVMVHGILHYCGHRDKSEEDTKIMREKENHYLSVLGR